MKRTKVWTEITEKTSSLGVAIRTPNEIKDKRTNLKKRGKKSIHEPQTRAKENRGSSKTSTNLPGHGKHYRFVQGLLP